MTTGVTGLRDFARRAVQGAAFADALRERGQAALENALQVYSAPHPGAESGQVALERLTDLERAMKAVVDRTTTETQANHTNCDLMVSRLNETGVAEGKLRAANDVPFADYAEASRLARDLNCSVNSRHAPMAGHFHFRDETARWGPPTVDKMQGVRAFIHDLHLVSGLYAAAVAAGPPALTVANFARETAAGAVHAESDAALSGSSRSGALYGLGLLGLQQASSGVAGARHAVADGHFAFDRTTTDERIVPVLLDLIDRLEQIAIYPAQPATIEGKQTVTGTTKEWEGRGLFSKGRPVERAMDIRSWNGEGWTRRTVSTPEYEPSHLTLPVTGVSAYVGS